jgi:hypothetical protein
VGFDTIGMSHLSTQYVLVPVAASKLGTSYNPAGDTVQFAFMPTATQVPGNSDWVSGSWETDTASLLYPYTAKCLVGPAGTITLGLGTYVMYLRISDSPEIPVLLAGQLQIT